MTSEQTTIGSELRRRREELGLTIEEMALRTRIGRTYLKAMEADHYDDFPGDAYQVGFLRNYAKALELDDTALVERFREETGRSRAVVKEMSSRPEPSRSDRRPNSATPRRGGSSKGKGMFWSTALAVIGAAIAAVLLSLPERPERPAPLPLPPASPAPATQHLPAQISAADAPSTQPQSGEVAPPTSAPASPLSSEAPELPFIPADGTVLRLVSLGSTELDIALDQKPPQSYRLEEKTALEWSVKRQVKFRVGNPEAVRFWLGDRELDLGGRSEVWLGPPPAASSEVKP